MDVDGMVTMVHDMPDVSLAMSLLDGNYTILPTSQCNRRGGVCNSKSTYVQAGSSAPLHSVATDPHVQTKVYNGLHHNCASQAVDGRYASVYQMSHCSVEPTSPPVQLTEFPPQKAEPMKGQGNFVVGGVGSGEKYTSSKVTQAYRGAMNWPDRSVYCPRQSHYEPDPFAHSLRKYPSLSPERSAEVIQRLINYTTIKNSSSIKSTKPLSPTRSDLTATHPERMRTCVTAVRARMYEDTGRKIVLDESPTRDSPRSRPDEVGEMKKAIFGRNYDVRYVREITRKAKENFRQVTYVSKVKAIDPYNHPMCPPIKERYDHLPPRNVFPEISKSHMETQAEIPMVSKEVTTLPRVKASTRNIAIPLSPSVSDIEPEKPTESPEHPETTKSLSDTLNPPSDTFVTPPYTSKQSSETKVKTTLSHKSIQTASITDLALLKPRKSVQTCISSIDLHETNKKMVKTCRKTKSQEEIRSNDEIDDELIKIIRELNNNYDDDTSFSIRNELLKKFKKIYKTHRDDKLKSKLGRRLRDQLYAQADYKHFTRELSNELISKIKASNIVLTCYDPDNKVSEDETQMVPYSTNSRDKSVKGLIREWLDEVPIKTVDYLGRPVKKEQVLQAVATKIKSLVMNKVHQDRCISLKPEILEILDDVPIEVNARNKIAYLNRIAHDLIKKIGDIFTVNSAERMRWQKAIDLDKTLRHNLKRGSFVKYDLPTDIELKRFVNQELREFTSKFRIKICASTENDIQIELVDILIDSFNDFLHGEEENIKEEILLMLSDFVQLSEHEGIYFVNNLMYNFKDFLKELHKGSDRSQAFVILRNTVKDSSNQTLDFTIQSSTYDDIVTGEKNNNLCGIFPSEQNDKYVYAVSASTSTQAVLTSPSQTKIKPQQDVTKKSTCIGTDMGGNAQMLPRSTSITKMECPRQAEQSRRASSPGGFTYGNISAQGSMQQEPMASPSPKPLCCDPGVPNPENIKKRIREDYEKFLKNWVEQIPIITSNPEEQAVIGLMRKGINNGVWKALTKLQMNPTTLSNRYHYQDVLDDELEELLDLLPESSELTKKKQAMKNQLIEKTVQMNEQLLHIGPEVTYKQQLVDKVASHMPRKTVGFTGSDVDKINEDIQKINLAETFIMYTMYLKHNDIVKANVYRKKLLKHIQEFLDEYKKTHGTDMINIDFAKCKDDILSDLYKVPPPSDETIRDEADEVLVGLEIEQWFEDLPLYPTDSKFEKLCRKRYRDTLAHKIHELEKRKNLNDCEDELRHEITRFMTKLPIREREIENTHFMVEELVNRLKNRPKDLVAGGNLIANFVDPNDYDEFSRHMPHCSSFSYAPGARKAQINESSYMARDGERVDDACGRFQYVGGRDSSSAGPNQSNQWYSLQEDGGHRELTSARTQVPAQVPDCCQSQRLDEPIGSAMASQLATPQYATLQQTQLGAPCCPDQSCLEPRSGTPGPSRSLGPQRLDQTSGRSHPQSFQQAPTQDPFYGRQNKSLSPVYQEPMPRIPEAPSVCSPQCFPPQFEGPRNMTAGISGNMQNMSGYPPPEYCMKPINNVPSPQPMPGRSTDTYDPYPSSKTYEAIPIRPNSSAQEKITPNYRKPPGSTPQEVSSSPRESRSKKRERERDGRSKREKKKEITDSDDSVKEEVRCRCMERIWRRKKKLFPPCEECDMLPPCFPMRFAPYPYFF